MKKGNFQKRPDVVGDISQDKLKANGGKAFNPGREEEFENAVQEERDQARQKIFDIEDEETDSEFSVDSKEDEDDGTLSVIDTSDIHEHPIEEDHPPDPEEQLPEEEEMPPRRQPRNQDAVSYAVLKPVIIIMEANDPEYAAYNRTHSRDILGIRVDIPSGVHPTAFSARVTSCRTKVEFTTTTIQSRYDAVHTIGNRLATCRYGLNITNAFDKALNQDWTKAVGPNAVPADVNTWSVNLPVKIEKRPVNPCKDWIPTPPGFNGFVNVVEEDHSIFWSAFYLVEEDPNLVDPMSSLGGMVDVSYQRRSNPMGTYEMQQARMENMERFTSAGRGRRVPPYVDPRRRNHHHPDDMSLDSSLDDDTSIVPPPDEDKKRWQRWKAKQHARKEAEKAEAESESAESVTERRHSKPASKPAARPSGRTRPSGARSRTQHSKRDDGTRDALNYLRNHGYPGGGGRPKYDSRRQESEDDYEEVTVQGSEKGDSEKGSRSGRSFV